jgi:sphingomyelin phosphodiesterase
MELDNSIFDSYWSNRYKQSPFTPECNEACRINTVCNIRAGKSELRCDYQPAEPSPDKPVILNVKDEEACGINLLKKNHHL